MVIFFLIYGILSTKVTRKGVPHMTTEERLTALETDRTTLTRIASEQMLRLRDIEHNEAILLGVVQSQGQDIRQLKADVSDIKERLARMERHFDERLDALMALVQKLQPPTGP